MRAAAAPSAILLLGLANHSLAVSIMADTNYIFGGDKPWDESQFTAVDDRVRGGSSVSNLTANADRTAATFHGNLDTKTLGGAGFASQRTVDPFQLDLTGVSALVAEVVVPADDKTYTLTLKNDALPTAPDRDEQSTVSWEYDFSALADGDVQGQTKLVEMPIDQFKPTYRGRPAEDAKLDLANIRRISFMMRSFFDQQDGAFSLTFNYIAAPKDDQAGAPARRSLAASSESDLKGDSKQSRPPEEGVSSWRRWLYNW